MSIITRLFLFFSVAQLNLLATMDKSPQPALKTIPSIHAHNIIRIPAQRGCFSLGLKPLSKPSTYSMSNFSIVGILYDHLEGRTMHLGSLTLEDLKTRTDNSTNIFTHDTTPDSAEFFISVIETNPRTKKATPHKASDFLTINSFSADSPLCAQSSYEPFMLTTQRINYAQKTWSQKGGYLRTQVKRHWNNLKPRTKNFIKAGLIAATVALIVLLGINLLPKKETPIPMPIPNPKVILNTQPLIQENTLHKPHDPFLIDSIESEDELNPALQKFGHSKFNANCMIKDGRITLEKYQESQQFANTHIAPALRKKFMSAQLTLFQQKQPPEDEQENKKTFLTASEAMAAGVPSCVALDAAGECIDEQNKSTVFKKYSDASQELGTNATEGDIYWYANPVDKDSKEKIRNKHNPINLVTIVSPQIPKTIITPVEQNFKNAPWKKTTDQMTEQERENLIVAFIKDEFLDEEEDDNDARAFINNDSHATKIITQFLNRHNTAVSYGLKGNDYDNYIGLGASKKIISREQANKYKNPS